MKGFSIVAQTIITIIGCASQTLNEFKNEFKITANDGAAGDWFGYSVSIDGDTAIIGAIYDDDNGSDSGSAFIMLEYR